METLIIYAHPGTPGHSPLILEEVQKLLKEKGKQFAVIDLYKIKYDPILHEDEHYTAGNYAVSKQNKEFQKKIADAKNLIFIYPIWWGSMPAILKGWCDRIFTPRYAYKYNPWPVIGAVPEGLLKGKKAVVFMTSGTELWKSLIGQGLRPSKSLAHDVLNFSGIKTKVLRLSRCGKVPEERRKEIQVMVRKGLGFLF